MAGGIGGEKQHAGSHLVGGPKFAKGDPQLELPGQTRDCLLYTSDAADERVRV